MFAPYRLDHAAYKLLVSSLYSSPASIIPGGIAGIVTPMICWAATDIPLFLAATAIIATIVALRVLTLVGYRWKGPARHSYADTRRWDSIFFAGATAFSAALGITAYFTLTVTDSPAAHMTTVSATIAFASGYVARNAARPFFVIVQLMTFCVPLAAGLLSADNALYHPIGWFTLFYVANNVAITFSVYHYLVALNSKTREARKLAAALTSRNVTLDAALGNMSHGLVMFDRRMRLAVVNSRFADLFDAPAGIDRAGIEIDRVFDGLVQNASVDRDVADNLAATARRVIATETETKIELVTCAGRVLVASMAPVGDGGVVLLFEDATERKAIESRLEHLARCDDLTGLVNRYAFESSLEASCSPDRMGRSFGLLYVDIDHFKRVNDNLGHAAGDLVLVEAARRLETCLPSGATIARFGGDEFLILVPGLDGASATPLGCSIVEALCRPYEIAGKHLHVTASIGVALAPLHGTSAVDLLRHADIALYSAKAAGRSTCMLFSPEMADAQAERHELEMELRKAFAAGDICLHYQPIVDLATGTVMSYEALMRWPHATRGMISPANFIPIAEESGLIELMGAWALRRACLDAATWDEQLTISVNVSPRQFREPQRLVRVVREALEASGLSPGRLALEVTESLLIEDQKSALEAIRELRRIGVRFSLDDFGTGFSSLAYLATFPFSQVKIDRSFARDVTTSANCRSIIEAVCSLARRLGMQVVVEGIETEEQRATVQALGADRAQGWLYGRPVAISAIPGKARRVA